MLLLIQIMYIKLKTLMFPLPFFLEEQCGIFILLQLFRYMIRVHRIPPYANISIRTRLLENRNNGPFIVNDVFAVAINRPFEFWRLSGETPESFRILANQITVRVHFPERRHLDIENSLLLTLIWLRQYPSYDLLSLCFGISVPIVCRIVNKIWIIIWEIFEPSIRWPSIASWRHCKQIWKEMPNVVGAIDGTSHEILVPQSEQQQVFYSGHRKYHCIHTQVILKFRKMLYK